MATNSAINCPTIVLGGAFTMSGAFTFTGTITGNTSVTFPTSGTLVAAGANSNITSLTGLTGTIQAPTGITSSAGLNLLTFSYTASAVNYLNVYNNVTGISPGIIATGSDASVGFTLQTKNGDFNFADSTGTIAPTLKMFDAAGTNYIGHKAPTAIASNTTYVWPLDGSVNNIFKTDGAGNIGFLTLATQAVQITGTSATAVVATGFQVYHPSAAKFHARVTQSAGTYTLQTPLYNVSSITKNSAGNVTVNLGITFTNVNYTVQTSISEGVNACIRAQSIGTTSFVVQMIVPSTLANADSGFSVCGYGTI